MSSGIRLVAASGADVGALSEAGERLFVLSVPDTDAGDIGNGIV